VGVGNMPKRSQTRLFGTLSSNKRLRKHGRVLCKLLYYKAGSYTTVRPNLIYVFIYHRTVNTARFGTEFISRSQKLSSLMPIETKSGDKKRKENAGTKVRRLTHGLNDAAEYR
jgi:hypothetical protein